MKKNFPEKMSIQLTYTNLFGGAEPTNCHRGKDVPVGGKVNVSSISFHSYSCKIQLKDSRII